MTACLADDLLSSPEFVFRGRLRYIASETEMYTRATKIIEATTPNVTQPAGTSRFDPKEHVL